MELIDPERLEVAFRDLSWRLEEGQLVKVVRRNDFAAALAYLNAVAVLAESEGHHPDFDLRWDTVTLHLYTHSLGGITDADLGLATKIDGLG